MEKLTEDICATSRNTSIHIRRNVFLILYLNTQSYSDSTEAQNTVPNKALARIETSGFSVQ